MVVRSKDFRDDLYARYVSTFKGQGAQVPPAGLYRAQQWASRKYLPLLRDVPRDGAILELGCGPGEMLALLDGVGYTRAEGIDIAEEQIHLAARRGVKATVADAFAFLAGKEDAFDAVIAIDFFEHFAKAEALELFELAHRALRGGGTLILQTPNGQGLFPGQVIYGDLTHGTIFNPSSLTQVLRLIGFVRIAIHETGPVLLRPRDAVRVGGWRAIRAVANVARMLETGKRQACWTENMICDCRKV